MTVTFARYTSVCFNWLRNRGTDKKITLYQRFVSIGYELNKATFGTDVLSGSRYKRQQSYQVEKHTKFPSFYIESMTQFLKRGGGEWEGNGLPIPKKKRTHGEYFLRFCQKNSQVKKAFEILPTQLKCILLF